MSSAVNWSATATSESFDDNSGDLIPPTSGGTAGEVVARKTFAMPDAVWDGRDYAALARSLSDAVGALSQEVVAALPEKK